MAEFWYDTLEGSLIVGDAAYEQVAEQQFSGQILPLDLLLTATAFPYRLGDFEQSGTRRTWSRDEKIQLGQWAVKLLETTNDPPQLLRKEHLYRLHILGLAPSYESLREFGPINSYRETIGSAVNELGHSGMYVNWSTQDYITYARAFQARLGHKPGYNDYKSSDGPPYHLISTRVGGARKLNEYLGYPNIQSWDDSEYVSWGVSVVKMNGTETFSPNLVRLISQQDMGPSVPTIRRRFTKWSTFKKQVLERYYGLPDEQAKRQVHLKTYRALHAQGQLPEDIEVSDLGQLEQAGARYLVVNDCLPYLDPVKQKRLMATPAVGFIKELRRHKPGLSAGQIEIVAVTHDVFDTIWPIEDGIVNLRVDPSELKRMHEHQRKTNTRSRAKAKQLHCANSSA